MPDSPGTRASLLIRLRDPDDAMAWNLFIDLYAPLIYGFFRRQSVQDADAADLTQDVLTRVSHAIRRLDYDPERGTFRGWLFTVVRNRWRTWAGRPQLPREDASLDEQPAASEDKAWEQDYRRRLFDWAVDQVKPTVASATWQAPSRRMKALRSWPNSTGLVVGGAMTLMRWRGLRAPCCGQ